MKDEGILYFYNLENTSEAGEMPTEKLVSLDLSAYYAAKTIGQQRLFIAQGDHYKLDKLVRCFNMLSIPETAKYVILEDGNQYMIKAINEIVDEDAIELSLERLSNNYDVSNTVTSQT